MLDAGNNLYTACGSTGLWPHSFGGSYGANVDAGQAISGVTGTASLGGGTFFDKKAGASIGGFASGGAAMYLLGLKTGAPQQNGQPFSFGVYAGAGPSVWLSNASSAQQLRGPFTTLSLNVGFGPVKGSAQLSYSNGIWQLSAGLPVPAVSFGTPSASVSKLTTTTKVTPGGCH